MVGVAGAVACTGVAAVTDAVVAGGGVPTGIGGVDVVVVAATVGAAEEAPTTDGVTEGGWNAATVPLGRSVPPHEAHTATIMAATAIARNGCRFGRFIRT